jgi:F-type H+-transporting ATPase subunit a
MDFKAVLKTRRGRLVLLGIVLAMVLLCMVGLLPTLGVQVAGLEGELPEISLAAEEIPPPYSQVILAVGLVAMLYFTLRLVLLGYRWALVALPVAIAVYIPYVGQPIPNTMPATWLTMIILIGVALAYSRAQRKEGPPSRLRVAVEAVADGLYSFVESVGGKHARLFFPLVATFFLFIALSNWCGILPGFGSVGVQVVHHSEEAVAVEHAEESEGEEVLVPFFRSANAHLSTTLALAVVSVVATHYLGFKVVGGSYSSRFLNFRATSPAPASPPAEQKGFQAVIQRIVPKFARIVEATVNGIVGLLEIILESLKVLPFSFRLFGNIFAGEVLLFVVSYLFAFVFPIIFLGLELFVGLIQGLIFAMLTLVFMAVAVAHHHGEESH